ncbi:MAG: tripartite tricarboxylate transporter permease [Bosea sp. (in: a-proteobacteria)]
MEAALAGLALAFTPANLLYAATGALIGTIVGVLPGLGPVATIALLLPASFHMSPSGALIMLAGVYYGAQYGSSTTAILINVPGEASGAVTAIEGHQHAMNGRAAEALAVAGLASLVAGLFAAVVLAAATPPLAWLALRIGPADTAALLACGALLAILISDASAARAILMLCLGGLLGLIGTAGGDGQPRFSFGLKELRDGIDFTPLVVGLFGLSEVLALMVRRAEDRAPVPDRWWPGLAAIRGWHRPALRGSAIGSVIGLLPGATTLFAAFAAYSVERKLRGVGGSDVDFSGVAAPEAANNAAAQTSFVMLFGLGLPANAATAVLIGAMMLHGLPPGPALLSTQPMVFWTFIGSLVTANIMLVVLNLPLVGLWARLITVPPSILAPLILAVACLGILASSGTAFDVASLGAFCLFGYACRRAGFPLMPLLMGFVIAAPFEDHLRRAITHARGDWLVVVSDMGVSAFARGIVNLVSGIATSAFSLIQN